MLTPEQWQKINLLFQTAVRLNPDEWEHFLNSESPDDPVVVNEVLSLLKSDRMADNFLKSPLQDFENEPFIQNKKMITTGYRVGAYVLKEKIGEGGMGIVFLAERADRQFEKQVSVKILRNSFFADQILRRFIFEQRILARLQHINIAQILDGGVTGNGNPYFVMEYVPGLPIDIYCNRNYLTLKQRLRLFGLVCNAVHYAHQNLVIHRDLKPGHILVTKDGIPKLLDFGIAKLLDQESPEDYQPLTRDGFRFLTPEYASPEQIMGGAVSTACDIYSLGVILYELLTGHSPYDLAGKSLGEIERIICEKEPLKPSEAINQTNRVYPSGKEENSITVKEIAKVRNTKPEILRRLLEDDLDNIILKSLQKEKELRYSSAEQFGEDIQRYLDGLPVRARKTTLVYRSSKFIKRHRTGVLAALLIVLSLITGLGIALWQNSLAQRQRDLALNAANTMVYELAEGLSRMNGPTQDRLGLLTRAAQVFQQISEESGDNVYEIQYHEADARRVLSRTYRFLGDKENALLQILSAEKIALELNSNPENNYKNKILLASILVEKGDVLTLDNRESDALICLTDAVSLLEPILNKKEAYPDVFRWYYFASIRIGDRLFYLSKLDSAAGYYRKAYNISAVLLNSNENKPEFLTNHATSIERMADISYYSGRVNESCENYKEALDLRRTAELKDPADVNIQRSLSIALQNVGWCEEQYGNLKDAVQLYSESIEIQERLLRNDPDNTLFATALMGGYGTLANLFNIQGKWDTAVKDYEKGILIGRTLINRGIMEARVENKTAVLSQLLAEIYLKKKMYFLADSFLVEAEELMENLSKQEQENTEYMRQLGNILIIRAELCLKQGRHKKEIYCIKKAVELLEKVSEITGMSSDKQHQSYAYFKFACHLIGQSDTMKARENLIKGKTILLNLRKNGELSDNSDGYKTYLPGIEDMLVKIP